MRRKTQRTLAALLILVLLVGVAPAAFAVDLDAKNTVIVNLAPNDKDSDFKKDIVKAGVQADLYLIAKAKPVEGFDTYEYENLPASLSAFQGTFDKALQVDLSKPETVNDQDTMLKKFTPFAYDFAEVILAEGFSAITPTSEKAADGADQITITNLDAGLYLLVLRGSDLKNKTDSKGEEGYVTKTTEQLSPNDTQGAAEKEHICTRAFSEQYEYLFEPLLITVPTKVDNKEQQFNTAFGEWTNTLTVNIKAERQPRNGRLKVTKTLNSYVDLSTVDKDENGNPTTWYEPATFVFDIIARETDQETDPIIFRRQVTMNFDEPGTKFEIVEGIPIGAFVWVEEIYEGAHYVGGPTCDFPIEIIVDDVTTTAEEIAEATFENKDDTTHRGGHGIENKFTFNEETGKWDWETDPTDAKK